MQELLQNIHHAVPLEDLLPKIGGRISVWIGWISFAAVLSRTIAALIEGKKLCLFPIQPRGHPYFHMVNAEIPQNPSVESEAKLPRVAVVHPLSFCIVHVLTCVLVFQFKGKDRNTVQHQNHIHTFLRFRAIVPLSIAGNMILCILLCRSLVQRGFRLEIANTEGNPSMLEAMPQNRE